MNVSYRHTQIGYFMIATLAAGVLGLSTSLAFGGPKVLVVVVAILGLCLLLFPTLTAVVEGDRVRCFFGLGLIRRETPVSEILAVSVVQNPWTYGWGLRLIPSYVFAFHERDELGPKMLARIAKHTGLKPEDL